MSDSLNIKTVVIFNEELVQIDVPASMIVCFGTFFSSNCTTSISQWKILKEKRSGFLRDSLKNRKATNFNDMYGSADFPGE